MKQKGFIYLFLRLAMYVAVVGAIFYFVYQNIWLILGLVSIGYVFVAEQLLDTENEVRDEREIL